MQQRCGGYNVIMSYGVSAGSAGYPLLITPYTRKYSGSEHPFMSIVYTWSDTYANILLAKQYFAK